MLSSLRRAATAACACLALVVCVGVPAASAGSITYFQGHQYIAPGYPWVTGPAHSITSNVSYIQAIACVGAIDVYGGNLSGSGACADGGLGTTISHPYCGCVLRDGAVYPYGNNAGWANTSYETR
jgi:hypothetical protein